MGFEPTTVYVGSNPICELRIFCTDGRGFESIGKFWIFSELSTHIFLFHFFKEVWVTEHSPVKRALKAFLDRVDCGRYCVLSLFAWVTFMM